MASPAPASSGAASPAPTPASVPQASAVVSAGDKPPAPGASALSPEDGDGETGEILWSNKTASLGAPAGAASSRASSGTIELTVPIRDGSFYLGDIAARITPAGAAALAKDRLVQIAAPLLRPPALARLKSLAGEGDYLPLPLLAASGFDIRFDAAKVELTLVLKVEERAVGRLSAGRGAKPIAAEPSAEPAGFAGYVNLRAGADYSSQPFAGTEGSVGARLALDGALRWSDIVLESAATIERDDGLTRGASRLVYDSPEDALRFSAGDISPFKSARQGGPDLLGLSVEKSYQKLQPGTNIRPTGSRSFRIERPSNVDVTINGHVVQRLHLRPGDYDLADLPLTTGANDVSLVIEDDVGERRTLDFTLFSGRALLAPGISEWALSAGVAARYRGGQPGPANFYSDLDYDTETPAITGYYERGLTADLTGDVHFQADADAMMGGVGTAFQTSFGFWTLDAALSMSSSEGDGHAGGIGYELANVTGADGILRSLRLAADYRSAGFAAIDMPGPDNRTMLDLSAVYSQDLPWDLSGSVSGNYGLGRGRYPDRYGAVLGLRRAFGPAVTAGISAGYESLGLGAFKDEAAAGFTASVHLSYRVDDRSSIDAAHGFGDDRSHLGYRTQQGSGTGSWNAQLDLDRTGPAGHGLPEDYGVSGGLGYIGNRGEMSVSQHSGLAGLDTDRLDQRTSVTAGTALALADGRVAVGRPVSGGYAVIAPHDNLAESEVTIGAAEAERAGSGLLGPALVSDLTPYMSTRIGYDVANLPVGYDLGAGAFELLPAYKSGYRLTVGSDYTVSAFGTLVDGDSAPLALITGTAREESADAGPRVTIFTNRAGRFGAQGLRPGRWLLEMASEPATRYVLDIPKDAVGLVKLETLRPAETTP